MTRTPHPIRPSLKYPLSFMKDLTVETDHFGRFISVRGPAYRMITLPVGAEGKYGTITKFTSDWARIGYEKVPSLSLCRNSRL